MSHLFRRRSITKSITARTSAKYKRQIKKKILPGYGKKGAGVIKDPKKSMYNAICNRTTIDTRKISKSKQAKNDKSDNKLGCGCATTLIFFGAIVGQMIGGNIGGTIGVILMLIIAIFGMI